MTTYTATYSPEDNKLRLYASSRLDADTYARAKSLGFKWAPKQELFVAPAWSPAREDFCIELAGEIEAEQSTMAERAEAKAERLEALSDKRRRQANAFSRAAHEISERFVFGQPILVGHHSERRARKDREKMDANMRKAVEADKAAGWWLYKASSAQRHANHKNRDDVRARRIKTLLAELRDLQRKVNHAAAALKMLEAIKPDEITPERAEQYVGLRLPGGDLFYWDAYTELRAGTPFADVLTKAINYKRNTLGQSSTRRWIEHTLNRLSYEREMLGDVPAFSGTITPTMLQEFTREHGADKPKGSLEDDGRLTVRSFVPLPAHIGDGCEVTMTADEWRDLMQSCGYEAEAKAAAKKRSTSATIPLLNINAGTITERGRYGNKPRELPVLHMTKAEYAAAHDDGKGVTLSACGTFRFRTCLDPHHKGAYYMAARVAVFLTDSKAHEMPTAQREAAE